MEWKKYILPILIVAGLAIFVLYPIFNVLIVSLQWGEHVGLKNFSDLFTTPKHSLTIWNSLWMATCTSVIATFLGLILSIVVFRTSLPLRMFFGISAVLPIIIPGFILIVGYTFLFGRSGLITYKLFHITWDIYSWKSVLIIQVLDFCTIAFMVISAVLMGINSQLEDAARSMGAAEWKVLTTITLPLARTGIISAALLVFLGSLADFSSPLIVGGKFSNLASASYAQMIGTYNPGLSSALNTVLLAICLLVFLLFSHIQTKSAGMHMQITWAKQKELALHPIIKSILWGICLIFSIGLVSLLISVIMSAFTRHLGANYNFTLKHFKAVWQNASVSTIRTIVLAMASSAIVSIGGLIIAYIITRVRIYGRGMLDLLSTFIFAIPGTFIGIGYALAFSHPPLVLSGTWSIILACIVVRTLPIGVRSGVSVIMQQDYVLEEASASLGASKLKTFFRVVVPIARPALLVSAIYTLVMTVQTVGAIIFIVSPGKKVLSVEAFESIVSMRFGQSGALASIMLGIGAAGMLAIYAIGHKEDIFVWLRKSTTMKPQV